MLAVGSFTLLDPIVSGADKALSGALGDSFIKGVPVSETGTIHVFLTLFVLGVVFFLAAKASKMFKSKLDDKMTARTFFEIILDALMKLMTDTMGKKNAVRFLPIIGSLAIFIFFSNVLALVPGMAPPTDNLNTTVGPSLIVFFATHIVGFKEAGIGYLKHFLGPITKLYALPLMALMFLIEIIGHLARPLSLSLRLFGNMFADHVVLAKFQDIFAFLLPIPNLLLGCVVVLVQTLVFSLLSIIYISLTLHDEEH